MRFETVPGRPDVLAERAAIWVADQLWALLGRLPATVETCHCLFTCSRA